MDAKLDLPFDADAMLEGLRAWVECESPTHDAAAVNRMMALAGRHLALMGASVETIPGRMGFGDCVRARFPHESKEKGILVLAHLDTVHPVGTLQNGLPFRREGAKAYGPGIQDMKGGTYLAIEAIGQLIKAGIPTSRPVTVLLTSDEEVGSPSTRDLIEAEAARHAVVLVPEPARPDGGVVTGRYAIARFNLRTTGRPSHAGARLGEGRSAIREMAKQIVAIEEMTTEACTFSVGVIHGGQWVNCVATHCDAESLSMAKRQEDLDAAVERMLALRSTTNDVQLSVKRGVTRPVWEPDGKVLALHATAEKLAQRLGFALPHQSSGGGSDGNFTGAMGIPTLDGLGIIGALAHTLEEHVEVESLASRGKLFAGLLQVV
ncbi:M20/M25/M40 family metallo-hydrolase [Sabulicella glaciei]|uniref:M20/M25/M40 family metallo-hydrolase n=1 Tax=Sabulicella glaciei TaxID=2984948 RepID=A0ABT3NX78_9PROT|nr:M20/M25/M40 family metallo-hydrolase [Roseococcus sp. MDT2-1-1]MCW8086169.1 M20/M25/M40 family metallo-hydrolase [Roseococcus sp. MDT2-1-1]